MEKEKSNDKKKYLHDLILAAVCLFVAAGVFLAVTLTKKPGAYAVVTVDGEEYGRYALSADTEVDISTDHGDNVLIIRDGKADMTDADCPDKLCVRQPAIDESGESIVCLPHRVVVTVTADAQSGGVDMVG